MMLHLWRNGEISKFLEILSQYAKNCCGEGSTHDTAILFGRLDWDRYKGKGEVVTEYFPSSGTSQCNVVFPVRVKLSGYPRFFLSLIVDSLNQIHSKREKLGSPTSLQHDRIVCSWSEIDKNDYRKEASGQP